MMENSAKPVSLEDALRFDPQVEIERICDFIKAEVKRRDVHGVMLGLSGGLDSTTCAYLLVRSLPKESIHIMLLPERDSSPAIGANAQAIVKTLNLSAMEKNLGELFELLGLYRIAPRQVVNNRTGIENFIHLLGRLSGSGFLLNWAQRYAFVERKGPAARVLRSRFWDYAGRTQAFIFAKLRARMMVLSSQAALFDSLVVCTTDRSEWLVGFYDPLGDGAGDIAPLRHLYKTQIKLLAQALGVPNEIVNQPSSGDLAAGLPNEAVMGLTYSQVDHVLAGLHLGMDEVEIARQAGVRRAVVKGIRASCEAADIRRRLPLGLETP
jgi:NAD+ synthase